MRFLWAATSGPDTWEIFSLVASVVSIALAAFAIWQASQFFRWSNDAQSEAEKAARGIEASVKKLEDLFDRLYADTFGMVRDTVSDMRKHIWSANSDDRNDAGDAVNDEIDKRTTESIEGLRDEVKDQIAEVVKRVGATNTQVQDLEAQLGGVIDKAIEASRDVEPKAARQALEQALRREFRRARLRGKDRVKAGFLVNSLRDRFVLDQILEALADLRDEGLIRIDTSGSIKPNTWIHLAPSDEILDFKAADPADTEDDEPQVE